VYVPVQDNIFVQDDGFAAPFPFEVKVWGWVLMIIPDIVQFI